MAVALVTGSSTGIGLATAIQLARNGYETYATMRNPDGGGGPAREAAASEGIPLHVLQLDVDDPASVERAVADITTGSGPIDVLVNNAGVGGGGPIELAHDDEVRRVFETNFFGALRMIRAVLPSMRERRTGAIVNVTSMGGRVTFQTSGIYCASKFALEAASESLAMEVAPFGVRVVIIEPGVVLTPIFSKPAPAPLPEHPAYATARRRFVGPVGSLLRNPTTADECAAVILDALTTDSPRLRYTVGSEAEALVRNRASFSDEEWIALANVATDEEHLARLRPVFGEKW